VDNQNADDTADLIKRVEELEARLSELTQVPPSAGEPTMARSGDRTTTSRRDLFKLAGAAAVGGAAASLFAASPASAADGSLQTGTTNTEEGPTWLRYDGSGSIGSTDLLTVYDGPSFNASDYPSAVAGWAAGGAAAIANGVYGYSTQSNGYGTIGLGNGGASTHGVSASSAAGYGLVAQGGLAPIRIEPAGTPGAPTSGAHALGEVYVDSNGVIYKCVTAGAPGTWAPLNSTVLLASPARVIDTRKGTGMPSAGPLTPNTTYTSETLTGANGIPAGALGLVGTVTFVADTPGDNLGGDGFLTVFPAGAPNVPNTSNVRGDTSHAIASGLTVALGTGANAGQVSLYVGGTTKAAHALLDVAAYII